MVSSEAKRKESVEFVFRHAFSKEAHLLELHGLDGTDLGNDQGGQQEHQQTECHYPKVQQQNGGQANIYWNVFDIVFFRIRELEHPVLVLKVNDPKSDEVAP